MSKKTEPLKAAIFFASADGTAAVEETYCGLTPAEIDRLLSIVTRAKARLKMTDEKLHILDAGCGTGNLDPLFADHFNAAVVAATPFEGELKTAQLNNPHPNVSYVQAGMPDMEGLSGNFHIVHSDCAFQYIKDQDRATTWLRWAALTKPGGIIALRYPDRPTLHSDSVHPSCEDLRAEILSCNDNPHGVQLEIVSVESVDDPLIGRREDKNTKIVEALVRVTYPEADL